MKFRKLTAMFLAVLMMASFAPSAVFASSAVAFTLSSDVEEGEVLSLGDTVTYTVGITENSGFCVGTLYFKASDSLTYVSSTLLGEVTDAEQAVSGDYAGAWGMIYLEKENYTETTDNFCTVTFRVDGLGDASVEFSAYELKNSSLSAVSWTVAPEKLTETVALPDKPVILTETLSDAVLGKNYSAALEANRSEYISWEVLSGTLPQGISLFPDGTLSGVPEEAGEFTFTVKASIVNSDIESEPLSLTLTVLEKPKTLELTDTSKYSITEDGYITKVVAGTQYSDFIGNFLNSDYVKVYDGSGNEVTDPQTNIGTGFTVKLMDGDSAVDSAEVVVLGDINGDGIISSVDYLRLRAYFNGGFELAGAYLSAAHVAGNENVTSVDYLRLRAYFNGNYNIYN